MCRNFKTCEQERHRHNEAHCMRTTSFLGWISAVAVALLSCAIRTASCVDRRVICLEHFLVTFKKGFFSLLLFLPSTILQFHIHTATKLYPFSSPIVCGIYTHFRWINTIFSFSAIFTVYNAEGLKLVSLLSFDLFFLLIFFGRRV